MKPLLTLLPCLFLLAFTACTEQENINPSNSSELKADFSHAYLITEELPTEGLFVHHIQLANQDVFTGSSLEGIATSFKVSYVSNDRIAAGEHAFRVGPLVAGSEFKILSLEYYDNFDFSANDNGTTLTPYDGTVRIGYEGPEMTVEVRTTLSGSEQVIARYRGTPISIDLKASYRDLELPANDAANIARVGDHEFPVNTVVLRRPAPEQASITGRCPATLILSAETPDNPVSRDQLSQVRINFTGTSLGLADGLMRIRGYADDYSDNFGLLMDVANINIMADGNTHSEVIGSATKGDADVFVQDDFIMVSLKLNNRDGSVTTINYRGPLSNTLAYGD